MTCVFAGYDRLEIGLIAISVSYGTRPFYLSSGKRPHPDHTTDFLAFSLIVYLVVRSNLNKVPIPKLFRTIAQDATYYFLFIFTSHLTFLMFLVFAGVSVSS